MKRMSMSKAFFKASFAITLLALLTLTFTVFRSRSMWPELLANSKTVSKPIGTDRIAKVGNSTVLDAGCPAANSGGSGYSDPYPVWCYACQEPIYICGGTNNGCHYCGGIVPCGGGC